MQYLISFLEGIITFLSPCLLPMLPIYISYFAGGGERSTKKTLTGVLGFVLGFTLVFTAMGALAGTLGSFLTRYQTWVNLVCGAVVILFGLNYMGVLRLNLFQGGSRGGVRENMGFFSAFLFGVIFSALLLGEGEGLGLKALGALLLVCMGIFVVNFGGSPGKVKGI